VSTRVTWIGRLGAVLAACSAVLHGVSLGHSGNRWVAALMLAMIVACLYCAYELWTRDTVRGWVLVAVMNLGMIGVHLPMSTGHHHGAAMPMGAAAPVAMEVATAVAVIEVLLAAAVLYVRTRGLAPVAAAPCHGGAHGELGTRTRRSAGSYVDRLLRSG